MFKLFRTIREDWRFIDSLNDRQKGAVQKMRKAGMPIDDIRGMFEMSPEHRIEMLVFSYGNMFDATVPPGERDSEEAYRLLLQMVHHAMTDYGCSSDEAKQISTQIHEKYIGPIPQETIGELQRETVMDANAPQRRSENKPDLASVITPEENDFLQETEKDKHMSQLRVDQSRWVLHGQRLTKQYKYCGLDGDDSEHILQIDINASRSNVTGEIDRHVCFFIEPSPCPNMPDGHLIVQLGLREKLTDAPFVKVRNQHAVDASLLLGATTREDANILCNVIGAGKDMQLLVFYATEDNLEQLLRLPIPNNERVREAFTTASDHWQRTIPKGATILEQLVGS